MNADSRPGIRPSLQAREAADIAIIGARESLSRYGGFNPEVIASAEQIFGRLAMARYWQERLAGHVNANQSVHVGLTAYLTRPAAEQQVWQQIGYPIHSDQIAIDELTPNLVGLDLPEGTYFPRGRYGMQFHMRYSGIYETETSYREGKVILF